MSDLTDFDKKELGENHYIGCGEQLSIAVTKMTGYKAQDVWNGSMKRVIQTTKIVAKFVVRRYEM